MTTPHEDTADADFSTRETRRLREQIANLAAQRDRATTTILDILNLVASPGYCSKCRRQIYLLRYQRSGKLVEHNPDGVVHRVTCPGNGADRPVTPPVRPAR